MRTTERRPSGCGFLGWAHDLDKPAKYQEQEAGIGGVQKEVNQLVLLNIRGEKTPLQRQAAKEKRPKEMTVTVVRLPS